MRLSEFAPVVESLNDPAPWRWVDSMNYEAVASIDGTDDLKIQIVETEEGSWVINFNRINDGKQTSIATGQGNEFKVFATVVDVIKSWWNEISFDSYHPDKISFSASKQDGDSPRRAKLYARFAQKFANKIGYNFKVRSSGVTQDVFMLTRPDDFVAESRVIFARKKNHGKSNGAQTQMFRCSSGPRAGRRVAHPSQCGAPQDASKKAAMIKTRARTEIRQARRAKKTKRKDPGSKLAKKLNSTRH